MKENSLIAFLFPGQGQGTIKIGMGQDIYKKFPQVRKIFFEADFI